MTSSRMLTYLKCFCCSKMFNVEELIEMNQNSVTIDNLKVDFSDLLLDVFCYKVGKTNL